MKISGRMIVIQLTDEDARILEGVVRNDHIQIFSALHLKNLSGYIQMGRICNLSGLIDHLCLSMRTASFKANRVMLCYSLELDARLELETTQKEEKKWYSLSKAYAFTLLGFALLLSIGLQVAQVWNTANVLKGKTNEAVLAVAAINVGNMYNGVRESAGQARALDAAGTTWEYPVSSEEVIDILVANLGLSQDGGVLTKSAEHSSQATYNIRDFQTTYENVESGLHFITTFHLEIPLKLGADILPPIQIPMKVDSTYEAKF